jgi:hypothetical protein
MFLPKCEGASCDANAVVESTKATGERENDDILLHHHRDRQMMPLKPVIPPMDKCSSYL